MKKCKTLILIISFIMIISFFIIYNKKENYIDDNYYVQKNDSLLSMNLEQTAGVGDYKTVTQSKWPTEGYVFNSELSRCENGSTLSWNDTNKSVVVSGNISDKCYVYFDIYVVPTLASYIKSLYTGTQGENNLYYHNETLENGASDNSYRYAGGIYKLTDAGKATGATVLVSYDDTTVPLIYLYCDGGEHHLAYSCKNGIQGFGVRGVNGTGYYDDTLKKAIDVGYVAENNINNYVCLGTTTNSCADDSLYRIIGVFDDKVKLIKYSSIGNMYWDDTGSYAWATASLNTYLNSQYLNGLGIFANIISHSIWKASDVSFSSNSTLESVFTAEMADNVVTVNTKIGLAYVSDYGFAADSSTWLNNGWQSDKIGWLKNFESWTITSQGGGSLAWTAPKGSTFVNSFVDIDEFSTRPTFYLNSDVSYISGTGAKNDPFIIN